MSSPKQAAPPPALVTAPAETIMPDTTTASLPASLMPLATPTPPDLTRAPTTATIAPLNLNLPPVAQPTTQTHCVVKLTFRPIHPPVSLRNRISLLFAQMQRWDPNLHLPPWEASSSENPITASKNLPTDLQQLAIYVKLPTNTTSRFAPIVHFRLTSPNQVFGIKRRILDYLKDHHIYMQFQDLASTNVLETAWVYQQHPDLINGEELRQEMIRQLDGFDCFSLKRRLVRPSKELNLTTNAWVIAMDASDHAKHSELFFTTFHLKHSLRVVPLTGFEKWDPNLDYTSHLLTTHNAFLQDTRIIRLDNLCNITDPVMIDAKQQSLTDYFLSHRDPAKLPLIHSISQFWPYLVHLLTTTAHYTMTLEKIDHYLDVQFPAHGILDQTILKDPNDPAPSCIGHNKAFPLAMSTFLENLPDLTAKKPLASHIDEEELTATLDITIKPTHLESLQSSLSSLT